MRYIVELRPGCWLAPWKGDPGRTCVQTSAKRYMAEADAKRALSNARKFRAFIDAKIVEVSE